MDSPPDVFIADTQEVIKEYKRRTLNLEPLGFHGLDTWMSLIVDSVGVESDMQYNKSLLQYEMAGDFLYDERPEADTIIQAAEGLIMGVYAEFKRYGLYDEFGMLPWMYSSLTADNCIVMFYYEGSQNGGQLPRPRYLGF